MQSKTLEIKSVYWTSECSVQAVKTCLPIASPYLHRNDPLLMREAGLLKAQESYLGIRKGKEKLVQLPPPCKSLGTKRWNPQKCRKMIPGLCVRADSAVPLQAMFWFSSSSYFYKCAGESHHFVVCLAGPCKEQEDRPMLLCIEFMFSWGEDCHPLLI